MGIYKHGKNLFDNTRYTGAYRATASQIPNGIRATTTFGDGASYVEYEIPNSDALLGKTVTLQANKLPGRLDRQRTDIRVFESTGGSSSAYEIAQMPGAQETLTFTFPDEYHGENRHFALLFYCDSLEVGGYVDYTDIQLELGSTATSYEPYTEPKVKHIAAGSKNLLNWDNTSKTVNGVTFTIIGNRCIKVNGTSTKKFTYNLKSFGDKILNGRYRLTGCPAGGSTSKYYIEFLVKNSSGGDVAWPKDTGNGVTWNFENQKLSIMYIVIENGVTLDNLIFRPMFVEGSETLPYEPYYNISRVYQGDNLVFSDILPDELQEVRYLESSGTQFINTGWEIDHSDYPRVVTNMYTSNGVHEDTGNYALFGEWYGSNVFRIIKTSSAPNSNQLRVQLAGSAVNISGVDLQGVWHEYDFSANGLLIDGIDKEVPSTSWLRAPGNSVYIFASRSANTGTEWTGYNANIRVKDFKCYEGSTLVRDFIPCYIKTGQTFVDEKGVTCSAGTPGLYDRANGVFYTNSGTGTFSVGEDV